MSVVAQDVRARLEDAAQGAVRDPGAGDVVDGMPCRWVVSPADPSVVSTVLAAAHELGLAVVPRGAGTKLRWGARPEALDVILDLSALDGLVEHAAGDLVAVVQAGRRLDDLQADLASAGQWLAVDPPRRGTVGGLVASATSGPVRFSVGPVRDLVIGTTMVRADGVVARAGGKVVKNVAGYDVGKLLTGSFGTLGVVTQVAFRLHPLPDASRWVVVPVSTSRQAQSLVLQVAHSHLVAAACELDMSAAGEGLLGVRIDGIAPSVEARAAAASELLGKGAQASETAPGWWGTEPAQGGDTLLRVSHELSCLAGTLDAIQAAGRSTGLDVHVRGSAGVGTLYAAAPESADAAAVTRLVGELRARTAGFGGAVVVLEAPAEVKSQVDVWGPVRGLDLMRRVKDQFDSGRVLSPGRYVGGI